ncbi:MAG: two-component regulator propeller domain-containing protein, partial [Bacteroidota bacterium]
MVRRCVLVLFFFFLGLSFFQAKAQQYDMTHFSSNSVGHSQVYDLLEDQRGYIWIGTWGGGLSRFDGQEFYTFGEKEGLASIYIAALLEDRQGNIWVGSDKGLSRYDGRNFEAITLVEGQAIGIQCIEQDSSGAIWLGTSQGLFRHWKGQTISWSTKSAFPPNLKVLSLYYDQQHRLWAGTNGGAYCLVGDRVEVYTEENGLTSNTIQAICEDVNGQIWLATIDAGIVIFDGREWLRFRYSDLLEDGLGINQLFRDRQGRIWVGMANQGVFIWDGVDQEYRFIRERDQEGLESDNIKSIIQDSWGDYWLGTSGGALSKYFSSDLQFTNYTEQDGLADREIYALTRDSLQQIWLATSRGISIFTGQQFVNYSKDNGFMDVKSRAIFADRDGAIWIGTEGKGLAVYDGQSYRFFRSWDGLGGDLIQDITQDSSGHIWVAMADAGIARLTLDPRDSLGNSYLIKRFGEKAGLPDSYIYDLHIDQRQCIWYASRRGGIGYIQNDTTIYHFGLADGLPEAEVRSIYEDKNGSIWGATARSGIFKFSLRKDTFDIQQFDRNQGLSSNNIYQITFDEAGIMWLGHQSGVDRIQWNKTRNQIQQVQTYRSSEGFLGGETCESAVLVDSSGSIWFGTMGGLVHYQAKSSLTNEIPPKLHFTNVRLAYDSIAKTSYAPLLNSWGLPQTQLVFPHHENQLAFEFQGINLPAPDQVTYSWQLQGLNNAWSPPQSNNSVNFAHLEPGSYVFKVKAFNEDQVEVETALEWPFTIAPPIWETWWFRLLAITTLTLFLLFILATWIRRIRRKAREEAARLEMEKNVLELEQKALQLQMNPHFIFKRAASSLALRRIRRIQVARMKS